MHYRTLGSSGLSISEIGLGCNRLGETNQPDDHWINLIRQAVDLGVTIFDTAEGYTKTRSEQMLGLALAERDDVYVATKASARRTGPDGGPVYTPAILQEKAEASLRRLGRDVIDIYQLHSPSRSDMENSDWLEGMNRLREQGKVRLRAVAVESPSDGIWLIEQGAVEVLQITHNILETEYQDELFVVAVEHGVGLLGRMPIARGVLTGKFSPNGQVAEGHRALNQRGRLATMLEKAEDLRPLAASYEGGMTRMAHHYSLTPKAISAIIPGARHSVQLQENVSASNGIGLPPELMTQIEALQASWDQSS